MGGGWTAEITNFVERGNLLPSLDGFIKHGFSSIVRRTGEESLVMTTTERALNGKIILKKNGVQHMVKKAYTNTKSYNQKNL